MKATTTAFMKPSRLLVPYPTRPVFSRLSDMFTKR